ncbi:putative ornithine carbamoyltransferase precursor [Catenaria anguillulae PL171]|uniref:ornithine carbamoyltransferase n=1 Tax=Catenaria anguillulae PL171 TaxID=765915 RepID=A0A1Y2H4V8_9FUNG|nr:putative ornithine carbamoyltransferase precursor [Catenaria anguillulae PL171]
MLRTPATARLVAAPLATVALSHAPRLCYSTPAKSDLPKGPLHLLALSDLTRSDLYSILATATKFKRMSRSGVPLPQSLAGKHLAVIFTKRSTRTRVAAETSMHLLGGHAIFLSPSDIQLGVNESTQDTALVLSRLVHGIFARVDNHGDLLQLRTHASVPVVNALSDDHHPTQALADALTMYEAAWRVDNPAAAERGELPSGFDANLLQGRKLAWVGDGNNVCHSLMTVCGKLGMVMSIATPPGYGPKPSIVADEMMVPMITHHPLEALRGADYVSTDCWISMGQEKESVERRKAFDGFKVTRSLMRQGGVKDKAGFLHCLPRKKDEVDDDVFYSKDSLVWEQAENRKWTIMAVMHHAMGVGSWQE